MSEIIITQARPGDEIAMAAIANSRKFDHQLKEKELKLKGFVYYTPDADSYRQIIETSDLVFVAKIDEKIVGFEVAYEKQVFLNLPPQLVHYKDVVSFVSDIPYDNLIFSDQTVVLPEFSNVGKHLIHYAFKMTRHCHWSCVVAHGPVKNKASISFINSFGDIGLTAELQEEIEEGVVTWGAYFIRNKHID